MLSIVYKNKIKVLLILFITLVFLGISFIFYFNINDNLYSQFILNELFGLYLYILVFIFAKKDIFEPIYLILLLFLFQYYVSAFFLYNMTDFEYIQKQIDNQHSAVEALYVVNLALVSFIFGYFFKVNKVLYKKLPIFKERFNKKLLSLFGFYMFIFLLFILFLLIYLNGGFSNFFHSIGIPHQLRYLSYLINFILIVPFVLFLLGFRRLSILAMILFTIYYMVTQSRSASIFFLFWYLVFLHYNGYKVKKYLIFVPIMVIVGYLFGFLVSSNGQIFLENPSLFFEASNLIDWNYLFVMSIGRLEELAMYLENVPSKIDYYYGLTMLMGATGLFRAWIPIEYEDFAFAVTSVACGYDAKNTGFAMGNTGIAELYVNFSYFGIVVGMFVYGMIFKTLYLWFIQNKNNIIHLILYIILAHTLFDIIRDAFSSIFALFSQALVLIILLYISNIKSIKGINIKLKTLTIKKGD